MSNSSGILRRLWWLTVPLLVVLGVVLVGGGWFVHQRFIVCNFHPVVEGQVYRSAQPTPDHLRSWVQQCGIRTVLNLRGDEDRGPVAEEIAAAKELGLTYHCIRLPNKEHPQREKLLDVIRVLETAERPIVFHCRSGADRSGVVGVIAAMAIGGKSYDEAYDHLSWRYMHVDNTPQHVAGMFALYEDYCRREGLGTGGWEQFRAWLETEYVGPREAPPSAATAR